MVNESMRFHFIFSKIPTNRSKVENMNSIILIKYYARINGGISGRF